MNLYYLIANQMKGVSFMDAFTTKDKKKINLSI